MSDLSFHRGGLGRAPRLHAATPLPQARTTRDSRRGRWIVRALTAALLVVTAAHVARFTVPDLLAWWGR